jgi:glycosyltransferase involved in cell wall biosynthesis
MKVAVVLPELDPHQGGGFTFQGAVHDALSAAAERTHHTFVFHAAGVTAGGDLRALPSGRRAVAARAAHQLVRHLEDDVLDVPRRLSPPTRFERSLRRDGVELVWFATPWADDCDLPYIFTIWDIEYLRQPWFPEVSARGEWRRRDRHYRRYVPQASAVIVPNAAVVQQLQASFAVPSERILELAHPTPQFALQPTNAPAASPPRPFLLYPAQLWPHKDHVTVLEALALLRARGRDLDLVLVGSDKGIGEHLRRRADELGVGDRVQFRGFVPTDELIDLYREAHALTYTSRFGPENLPPLEAFALGCPAIVADVPGARQQFGDAALLIPVGDPEALADAVVSLEDPVRRATLTAAGAARAQAASAAAYVDGVLAWIDAFEPTVRRWR